MHKIFTAEEVLKFYCTNHHLAGSFSEDFGRRLTAIDRDQENPRKASFRYVFGPHQKNIQESIHGGALTALIDVITTIAMIRVTHYRTVSLSLNTQFLNAIKVGSQVEIETEVLNIHKNIIFSECKIYTDFHHKRKLACKGEHIKSIIHDYWNFMPISEAVV